MGDGSIIPRWPDTIQGKHRSCVPHEKPEVYGVGNDELIEGGDGFINVFEHGAPNALFSNLGKPALYLVEPRTAGRSKT